MQVVIIGAGCIGAAVARELAKSTASVLVLLTHDPRPPAVRAPACHCTRAVSLFVFSQVLEAADDVTQGATKGNSGIVHAGFDDAPGSVRSRYCWPGNQMFPQLDRELHFGLQATPVQHMRTPALKVANVRTVVDDAYAWLAVGVQLNGSLVVAKGDADEAHLQELLARGAKNGVKNLRVIGRCGGPSKSISSGLAAAAAAAAAAATTVVAACILCQLTALACRRDELRKMEPHIHPAATAALWSPDAGTVVPYEYAIALAENAADNGVEFRIRREVTAISQTGPSPDGSQAGAGFAITVRHWEPAGAASAGPSMLLLALLLTSVLGPAALLGLALSGRPEAAKILVPGAGLLLATGLAAAAAYLYTGGGGGSSPSAPIGTGGAAVTVEEMKLGGSGSSGAGAGPAGAAGGSKEEEEEVRCKYVVNCAGGASDKVAAMIGDQTFKIKPRLGEYLLLHKDQGHLAGATLFPCPGPLGKGVLVQGTVWGNLILGPTARDVHNREHDQTGTQITAYILERCRQLVPAFDAGKVIHAFAGARAKSDRNDWIIEPSATSPCFVHAAGIDSPGLAGSPAIANRVVELLKAAGLANEPDAQFNPVRAPLIIPKNGWKGPDGVLKAGPVGKCTDPATNVVCKCEKVTEVGTHPVVARFDNSIGNCPTRCRGLRKPQRTCRPRNSCCLIRRRSSKRAVGVFRSIRPRLCASASVLGAAACAL